jgi:hypothetical protein
MAPRLTFDLYILTLSGRPVYSSKSYDPEELIGLAGTFTAIYHRISRDSKLGGFSSIKSPSSLTYFYNFDPLLLISVSSESCHLRSRRILELVSHLLVCSLTKNFINSRPYNFDFQPFIVPSEKTISSIIKNQLCRVQSDVQMMGLPILPLNYKFRRLLMDRLNEDSDSLLTALVKRTDGNFKVLAMTSGSKRKISFSSVDLNVLFTFIASQIYSGECSFPFCFPSLDENANANIFVKIFNDFFMVSVNLDDSRFYEVKEFFDKTETFLSDESMKILMAGDETCNLLPRNVKHLQISIATGQTACLSESDLNALGGDLPHQTEEDEIFLGYDELMEQQNKQILPRQIFKRYPKKWAQYIWSTSEFEMHVTACVPPETIPDIYGYIKEKELQYFIPFKIPVNPWPDKKTSSMTTTGNKFFSLNNR